MLKELRTKRAKAVADARAILDAAEKEGRGMNAEETGRFDRFMSEADALKERCDRAERLEKEEAELNASAGRRTEPTQPEERSNPGEGGGRRAGEQPTELRYRPRVGGIQVPDERMISFLNAEGKLHRRASEEYQKRYNAYLRDGRHAEEFRALQADSDADGGFLTAPMQMVSGLLKGLDDDVFIRGLATVMRITESSSLGTPSLDTDVSDADWTSEIKTGSEDSSMKVGQRELKPSPLAKRIKISETLTRKAPNASSLVEQRLRYKFGITEEKGFLTGNGANQPLGLFTAHADGIPATRDVSADNTATAFTADGLINAKYSLKAPYWKNARWLFHRDAVKMLAKLKDGESRYYWMPGLQSGQPDKLLDVPVITSEYVPNTFTTGLYVGMIADFSFYWIVEALSLRIQRLEELYAESNQIGFIGRMEVDGMPVLSEAFARVKLA